MVRSVPGSHGNRSRGVACLRLLVASAPYFGEHIEVTAQRRGGGVPPVVPQRVAGEAPPDLPDRRVPHRRVRGDADSAPGRRRVLRIPCADVTPVVTDRDLYLAAGGRRNRVRA